MSEQTELSLVADAETALKNGDLFKAYDIAAAALEAFPASGSLRYQAVLALARSGATENAQRLYEKGSSGKRVGESDGECGLKAYGYWVFGVS